MTPLEDKASYFASRAIDFLLTKHPTRTGLGVVLGLVIGVLVLVFEPSLRSIKDYVNLAQVPLLGWLPVGIAITHVRTLTEFFKKAPITDEAVDEVMAVIERGNFGEIEKRRLYRQLIEKAMNKVALSQPVRSEISAAQSAMKVISSKERGDPGAAP